MLGTYEVWVTGILHVKIFQSIFIHLLRISNWVNHTNFVSVASLIVSVRDVKSVFNLLIFKAFSFFISNTIFDTLLLPIDLFLGAFAKFKNSTISFVMSVCPSGRPSACNNSAPTARILLKLGICSSFENLSRKLKFHWSSTKITGTLHENVFTFITISR